MRRSTPKYNTPPSPNVTAVMKGNKGSDTKPEVRIRSCLHKAGYRFRKDFKINTANRSCRPDIVFTRQKLAIFIDGCFWHFCPDHGNIPRTNTNYWKDKLTRNMARDKLDTAALISDGWKVIRIWEHMPPDEAFRLIVKEL